MKKPSRELLRSTLAAIGVLLVAASLLKVNRMTAQFWDVYRVDVSLPVDLNPVCAAPEIHTVDARIDGGSDVQSDGRPIVSIYAVMPERTGQLSKLVRNCLVPLPYTRTYTSRTCDPYRFGAYGIRNGVCQVWIDGVLQPGWEGFVLPEGAEAVLLPEPKPWPIFVVTQLYFVLVVAVAATRSWGPGTTAQLQVQGGDWLAASDRRRLRSNT